MAEDNLRVQLLLARWSEKDLERMKALHASGGMNAVFKAFPKRSAEAIHQKALKLGLRIRAKWTSRDDRLLRNFWGDLTVRDIANKFGRTEVAVCFRAQRLGLKLGRPQGWAYLSTEAKRIGIASGTLRKLLKQSAARIVPTWNVPVKSRSRGLREGRPMLVDPYDVDLAAEKYLDEETLNAAATRRGTSAGVLRKGLEAIGVVPPKSLKKNKFWRIPSADIDRALTQHAQTKASHDALYENLKEAAARMGVSRVTLVKRLKQFRVHYEPKKVLRADVDRVTVLAGKREADLDLLNVTMARLGTSRQVVVEWLKAAGTPHLAGHLDVETFRQVVLKHERRWELRDEDAQYLRDCAKELGITHTAFVWRLRNKGVEYRIGMLDRDKLREVIAEGQKAIADQALLVASAARIGTPVSLLLFNLRKRGFAYLAGELDPEQVEAVVRVLLHRKRDRALLKSAAKRARRSMSHFANRMRAEGYDPRIGILVPEEVEAIVNRIRREQEDRDALTKAARTALSSVRVVVQRMATRGFDIRIGHMVSVEIGQAVNDIQADQAKYSADRALLAQVSKETQRSPGAIVKMLAAQGFESRIGHLVPDDVAWVRAAVRRERRDRRTLKRAARKARCSIKHLVTVMQTKGLHTTPGSVDAKKTRKVVQELLRIRRGHERPTRLAA